jgi:hypothetical protein
VTSTRTPAKPASAIALQAEQLLYRKLVRIGNEDVHYLRCFRTGNRRELAVNLVNAGIDVWTEAVWERATPSFQAMRKKRYAEDEPRISTLQANAPRLYRGNVADYWRFPTLSDLDAFTDWYKTQ